MCKVLETAEVEVADLQDHLDQACWELECHRDVERNASRAKESVHEEIKDRHLKELSMKDEIISLLKEKLATKVFVQYSDHCDQQCYCVVCLHYA